MPLPKRMIINCLDLEINLISIKQIIRIANEIIGEINILNVRGGIVSSFI